MSKKILLAAAALSAIAVAGGANAASVTARAGTVAVTPTQTYALASQLNYSAGITSAAGEFDTVVTFNNRLGSGTYTVTLTYSGATINAGVSSTGVTQVVGAQPNTAVAGFENGATSAATAATLTLSSGGTVGSDTISYTLQVPAQTAAAGDPTFGVAGIYLAPALRVSGPVSVTASVTNQVTGQPVDPSVIQPLITTSSSGFTLTSAPDATKTAIFSNGGAFNQLGANTTLGTITVSPVANVYADLNGRPVAAADITGGSVSVTGSMTGLNVSIGGTVATKSGDTATATVAAAPLAPLAVTVATTAGAGGTVPQLNPSSYRVSGTINLGAAFAGPLSLANSPLETVDTQGLSYIIPWVSSRTQGAATGSRTVIRISRVGSEVVNGGEVYAQLLNPIRGQSAGNWALVGNLTNTGNGEVVLSSDTFETAFGDFGRGDIRLALTPNNGAGFDANYAPLQANNIIVKRVIAQPNGGVAEMDVVAVGTNGSPQDVQTNFAAAAPVPPAPAP